MNHRFRLVSARAIIVLAIIPLGSTVCPARTRRSGHDVPVPARCTPNINQKLAELIAQGQRQTVDNVMVCGITARSWRTQHGGPHGDHQTLSVAATIPDGSTMLIEIVTNDALNGKVTAPARSTVFAYGQAFFNRTHPFAAGIHDVHCATHRGADNGWIVVNGEKHPASCPSR